MVGEEKVVLPFKVEVANVVCDLIGVIQADVALRGAIFLSEILGKFGESFVCKVFVLDGADVPSTTGNPRPDAGLAKTNAGQGSCCCGAIAQGKPKEEAALTARSRWQGFVNITD